MSEDSGDSERLSGVFLGALGIRSPSHFHLSDTTRQRRPTLGANRAHLVRDGIRTRSRRRSGDTATLALLMVIISRGSIYEHARQAVG